MTSLTQNLLGNVFSWTKGKKPSVLSEDKLIGMIPYLTASYFRTGEVKYWANPGDKNIVDAGIDDVILIWDGSNAGDVFMGLRGALASTMVKFSKSEKYLSPFLYFFLKTKFEELNARTIGSTIPHVNGSVLKDFELPAFNLIVQQTIATILSKIQEAIENQDKIIKTTTELKKSLMKKIFSEGLNGVRVINKKLGDVLTLNYGKGLPEKRRTTGKIPVYGSNGIVGWHNQPLVDEAGIIVGRKGSVGKVHYSDSAFYPIDTTYYVTQKDTKAHLKFLYYLLNYVRLEKIKGDVGVPGLNREMAYLEQVPYINDLKVQKEIAKTFSAVDAKIENAKKIKSAKEDLFKSMLNNLMSGKIRVHPVR